MRLKWLGAAVAACLLAPILSKVGVGGQANPIEVKARRDEAFILRTGDTALAAAYEKGRATLDGFLAVNEARPANSRAFSVKIPVRDAGKVEWFWISQFKRDGDRFRGILDNTPRIVTTVRQDQEVGFQRSDIVDWTYVQDDKIKGNFTACALLAKEEPKARDEFARKFGLDCSG